MPNVQTDASLQLTMNAKDNAGGIISGLTGTLDTLRGMVGAAGLAAAGAFEQAIAPTVHYAETLQKTEVITGLTANQSAGLLAGFAGAGIGADQASPMIQRLEMRLGRLADSAANAKTSGGAASRIFADLGVAVRDAHGNMIPMTELMPNIIDGLNKIEDPTKRALVASQLFGRAYGELAPLLARGGAGFRDAEKDAARFGLTIGQDGVVAGQKFTEEQSRMGEALLGLKVMLGEFIIPYITQLFVWIENLIAAFQTISPPIKDLLVHLLALVAIFGTLLGGATAISGALGIFGGLLDGIQVAVVGLATPMLAFLAVIGLLVAAAIGLYWAYNNVGAIHRYLAPLVKEAVDLWNRLKEAFQFFINSVSVIGPINALGGALKIVGLSTHDVLVVTGFLAPLWKDLLNVVATVKQAFDIFSGTLDRTHSPLLAIEAAIHRLGVPMDTITGAVRIAHLLWNMLAMDFRQLVAAALPALQQAMITLHPAIAQIVGIVERMLPVIKLLAEIIAVVVVVAVQTLIQIFIATLPEAIKIATAAFMIVVDVVDIVTRIIAGLVQFVVDIVHGNWKAAWADLVGIVQGIWPLIVDVFGRIFGIFGDLITFLSGILGQITNGFVAGLQNALVNALRSVINFVGGAIGWFQSLPSTLLNIVDGIAVGLFKSASNLGATIVHGLVSGLSGMNWALGHAMKWAIEQIPVLGSQIVPLLGLANYAGGGVVGPGMGGAHIGVVGEGREIEVISTLSQAIQAGMMAARGAGGGGGGGGETVIPLTLTLDGAVLAKIVLRRGGQKWKLQAGTLGSGA
jgi:hypothetical protein